MQQLLYHIHICPILYIPNAAASDHFLGHLRSFASSLTFTLETVNHSQAPTLSHDEDDSCFKAEFSLPDFKKKKENIKKNLQMNEPFLVWIDHELSHGYRPR